MNKIIATLYVLFLFSQQLCDSHAGFCRGSICKLFSADSSRRFVPVLSGQHGCKKAGASHELSQIKS